MPVKKYIYMLIRCMLIRGPRRPGPCSSSCARRRAPAANGRGEFRLKSGYFFCRGCTRESPGCARTTWVDKPCSGTTGPRSSRPVSTVRYRATIRFTLTKSKVRPICRTRDWCTPRSLRPGNRAASDAGQKRQKRHNGVIKSYGFSFSVVSSSPPQQRHSRLGRVQLQPDRH